MAKDLRESKKSGASRIVLVIIISFLMLPIVTASILYFTNENFQYTANDFLGFLPGRLGGYFESQPTREEKEELKSQIAKHYITLEEDRLIDKLLLIKGEDIRLYNDLLINLNRLNPKKMSRVKDEIRKRELEGDILFRIVTEIDIEHNERIDSLIRYYSSLSFSDAVEEIKNSFSRNEISSEDLALVFQRLPLDISSRLLTMIDSDLANRIRYLLPTSARRNIDKQINENKFRESELIRMAKIYEEKSIDELVAEIGNTEKYRINELAIIYSNLTYKKSGEVLSRVDDQEFIFNLYNSINRYEELNNLSTDRTVELAKALQTMKNYNNKVRELADIYQRLPRQDLARIVEQMMRSNEVVVAQNFTNNERIVFTQQQLIVDVLRQFRTNVVTEILGHLDTRRATELSRRLVE